MIERDEPAETDVEAAGIVGPRRLSCREQLRQAWAWHWQHNRRFVLLTVVTASSAVLHAAGRLVGVW